MGSVMSYLNYVSVENPKGKSLTSLTVYAGWTVTGMTVHRICPFEDACKKLDTGVLGLLERILQRSIVGKTIRHRGLVL